MPYDVVQICNLALSHCASQQFLATLDEDSTEADLCNVHYEPARDAVLRELHWPFARRYVALALVEQADAQAWADEWGYAYRYPADCVRIRRLLTGARRSPPQSEFELGSEPAGKLIFCDVADAMVAYTHRIEDPSLFSDEFAQAVAWRMASLMALPLSSRTDLRQQAMQEYERLVAAAKFSSLNEQRDDDQPEAESIRARN